MPTAHPLFPTATGTDAGNGSPSSRLLDSVARITLNRDADALDHSLVLSLGELTGARSVTLDRRTRQGSGRTRTVCRPGADGQYAVRVRELGPDDRVEALEAGIVVPVLAEAESRIDLIIAGARDGVSARALAEGFARIYVNYIALIDESERDKLTGLYNRRAFERHLRRLLQAGTADADGSPRLWLAIFDIDHFKRINDTYGHLYGDEVILLLAQRMRASFRSADVLFRFGGEEFVALLHAEDVQTVSAVLERFRGDVDGFAFPQVGHVSVSVGYTRFAAHDHPEVALERADKALYFAKENGRNRCAGFEALAAEGILQPVHSGSIDLF